MLTSFGLKPGDVFTWDNCPFREQEGSPLKKRWFVLLGFFMIESQIFVITTTTRFEHYGPGNPRQNHVYFKLPAGAGGLSRDSIVDFSQDFQDIYLSGFEKGKTDISKEGTLSQDTINSLVNCLEKERRISKIIKRKIYECLRESGFKVNKK
jgi:hypothetical protein